jgi:hypothetical protein
MKLKTIFTVNYIYAFLFGVGFMFFPALCCSLVGFALAGDASLIARCMGIFVLCTGILIFFARNGERSVARRAILLSLLTLYVLLIVFKVLLNILWGFSLNLMFAILYVFHIGLITAYAYQLFGRPREIDS